MPTTTSSALFSGASALVEPNRQIGANIIPFSDTVPTTELGEAGDRRRLTPIGDGLELLGLYLTHGDGDTGGSPALDGDIVLADANGDTILYNAGAAFQAAGTGVWVLLVAAPPRVKGKTATIDFKTNTAAATAQAFAIAGIILARG